MKASKILLTVFSLTTVLTLSAQRRVCIDTEWQFFYGNGRHVLTTPDATATWRTLDLPHDWSVESEAARQAGGRVVGPFSTNSVGGYQTGHTVGGEGWYAKTLSMTAADMDGRVVIYFEGAYNQSYVYINGELCHTNVYGYSSFRVDATDHLHVGDNQLVVRVVNNGNNSRWYAGSGIYRHVWLIRTAPVYVDEWDTYVQTADNHAVKLSTIIHNTSAAEQSGTVEVCIKDAGGHTVSTASVPFNAVVAGGNADVELSADVANASTWSPDSPVTYSAVLTVKDEQGNVVDEIIRRFGFRTLSFSATEGFLLNGQPTLLRGGCVHHDNGLLGAAAYDKAELRKLKLIKSQGYNAVRCSHNLPSEHFLDVCDSLGLMVIDECFDQWLRQKNTDDYSNYFSAHSDEDISVMLRRDRNHPSIIMWSIGNEIPGRIEPAGMEAAARLRDDVLKYDTTRPVTAAICGWDEGDSWNSAARNWDAQCEKAFLSLDVGGYNYLYDKYERDHAAVPSRVMCGLESYPKQASENWNLVERLPYVIGDFVWTAMDYLGEAGIGAAFADHAPSMFQSWPWFNGYCGDIDLIGQKKPQSYYRDVVWRQAAVTMAVQPTTSYNNAWGWQLEEQSWTFPGREGSNVTVNVYSRAAGVRLYLNGKSQGDKKPGSTFFAGYSVKYEPGTLRVVNLDADGTEIDGEEFVLTTTGEPVGLRMVYEDETISAEPNDLAYVTIELVDADGRVVTSDSETQISIENTGCGELLACGTASPTDMKSFRSSILTLFRGRALAIIRSNGTSGNVSLKAEVHEPEPEPTVFFFNNPDFETGDLDSWTISSTTYIKQNDTQWHDTQLDKFMECFTGWGSATTLRGQYASQSTKVLPAGKYTVLFDYNGTVRSGTNRYTTTADMTGVTVSVGGQTVGLETISADSAQHAVIQFSLDSPQAVTFLLQFASTTNADWFALDNIDVSYEGDYDFPASYLDYSNTIPDFDGQSWPKLSGNAAGSYIETKLGSAVYNGSGLAYWSQSAPRNVHLFEQGIASLPAGKYGVAAFAAANLWSSNDNDRNHRSGTYFFATAGDTVVKTQVETATYGLCSLVVDVAEGEKLTIGLLADTANGNNWCYLAGITLVQLSAGRDDADAIDHLMQTGSGQTKFTGAAYDLGGRQTTETDGSKAGIYIIGGRKVYRP